MPAIKVARQPSFIHSRKRSLFLNVVSPGYQKVCQSYWDGGSCDEWGMVEITNGTPSGWMNYPCNVSGHPVFDPKGDNVNTITEGRVLVESGTFCGKPATPTLYGTARTLALALLPLVREGKVKSALPAEVAVEMDQLLQEVQ